MLSVSAKTIIPAVLLLSGCLSVPGPKVFNPVESCRVGEMEIPAGWAGQKKVRRDEAVEVIGANRECLEKTREPYIYNYRLAEKYRCGTICEAKKITPWAIVAFLAGLLVGL